jgi:hypothetical protein
MVKILKSVTRMIFVFGIVQILVACPSMGDRILPSETSRVSMSEGRMCFETAEPENYYPTVITIIKRNADYKTKIFFYDPIVTVNQGKVCFPSSLWQANENGVYIISYVLQSKINDDIKRIVTGVEIMNGKFSDVPLMKSEYY